MRFDMGELSAPDRYKLLAGMVIPRPIALVTTLSADGEPNAAPFSFFNCFGADPPVLALGIGDREPNVPKDTVQNIESTREFVVNIVAASMAEAMNVCAVDFPRGVNEMEAAGFAPAASMRVKPPGIAQAPARLECRLFSMQRIGSNTLVIGEVLAIQTAEGLVDGASLHVNWDALGEYPLGRLTGSGYVRLSERFSMPRQTYSQWQKAHGERAGG